MIEPSLTHPDQNPTPGVLWVERFLLPLLQKQMTHANSHQLCCLQIEPIDSLDCLEETKRIRQQGHLCDVALYKDPGATPTSVPNDVQVIDDLTQLPLDSARYDLILCGRFGKMTRDKSLRLPFANELARVCKPRGAFLATFGNRHCPIDLSGNSSLLHGPASPSLLSIREAKNLFLDQSGFSSAQSINLYGHFGWSKVSGIGTIVAKTLDIFWRWCATPQHPWLYASPVNPCFMLWINR